MMRGREADINTCFLGINLFHLDSPIEASTSLKSSLLMIPSLFWSMIVKAWKDNPGFITGGKHLGLIQSVWVDKVRSR